MELFIYPFWSVGRKERGKKPVIHKIGLHFRFFYHLVSGSSWSRVIVIFFSHASETRAQSASAHKYMSIFFSFVIGIIRYISGFPIYSLYHSIIYLILNLFPKNHAVRTNLSEITPQQHMEYNSVTTGRISIEHGVYG